MRSLKDYMIEALSDIDTGHDITGGNERNIIMAESGEDTGGNESDKSIKSEQDFRDYAEHKFKTVFADKLDRERMNKVIDGILDKNKEKVKENNWGSLIGILNKSFGHN